MDEIKKEVEGSCFRPFVSRSSAYGEATRRILGRDANQRIISLRREIIKLNLEMTKKDVSEADKSELIQRVEILKKIKNDSDIDDIRDIERVKRVVDANEKINKLRKDARQYKLVTYVLLGLVAAQIFVRVLAEDGETSDSYKILTGLVALLGAYAAKLVHGEATEKIKTIERNTDVEAGNGPLFKKEMEDVLLQTKGHIVNESLKNGHGSLFKDQLADGKHIFKRRSNKELISTAESQDKDMRLQIKNMRFYEYRVYGDGDCGFTAIGKTREEVYEELIALKKDRKSIKWLVGEILESKEIKRLSGSVDKTFDELFKIRERAEGEMTIARQNAKYAMEIVEEEINDKNLMDRAKNELQDKINYNEAQYGENLTGAALKKAFGDAVKKNEEAAPNIARQNLKAALEEEKEEVREDAGNEALLDLANTVVVNDKKYRTVVGYKQTSGEVLKKALSDANEGEIKANQAIVDHCLNEYDNYIKGYLDGDVQELGILSATLVAKCCNFNLYIWNLKSPSGSELKMKEYCENQQPSHSIHVIFKANTDSSSNSNHYNLLAPKSSKPAERLKYEDFKIPASSQSIAPSPM